MSGLFVPVSAMRGVIGGGAPSPYPILSARSMFSTATDYFTITDAAQTGLDLTTFTIEHWRRFDVLPTSGQFETVGGKWTPKSYLLYVWNDAGTWKLRLFVSINGSTTNVQVTHTLNTAPVVGEWTHLAFTYDSTQQLDAATAAYQDGVDMGAATIVAGTPTTTYVPFNGTSDLLLGGTGSGNLEGRIDDYRIWSTARTPSEIANFYDTALVGDESGLVANWKFDGDLTDATANGNDLTAGGLEAYSNNRPRELNSRLRLDYNFEEPTQQAFPTDPTAILAGSTASEIWRFEETSGNFFSDVTGRQAAATGQVARNKGVGLWNGTDMFSKGCFSAHANTSYVTVAGAGSTTYFDLGAGDSGAVLIVYRIYQWNTSGKRLWHKGTTTSDMRTLSSEQPALDDQRRRGSACSWTRRSRKARCRRTARGTARSPSSTARRAPAGLLACFTTTRTKRTSTSQPSARSRAQHRSRLGVAVNDSARGRRLCGRVPRRRGRGVGHRRLPCVLAAAQSARDDGRGTGGSAARS